MIEIQSSWLVLANANNKQTETTIKFVDNFQSLITEIAFNFNENNFDAIKMKKKGSPLNFVDVERSEETKTSKPERWQKQRER